MPLDIESLEEDLSISTPLTPEDETFRELGLPLANVLSWGRGRAAQARPCGDGEEPERGHCNPNLPNDPYRQQSIDEQREQKWDSAGPDERADIERRKQSDWDLSNLPAPDPYTPDTPKQAEIERSKMADWQAVRPATFSSVAALNWSSHKAETFDDTGEKGYFPAWGLKSVIDRGVKPHEKQSGAKRIGQGENQTQKRTVPSKNFKSYSMVETFNW